MRRIESRDRTFITAGSAAERLRPCRPLRHELIRLRARALELARELARIECRLRDHHCTSVVSPRLIEVVSVAAVRLRRLLRVTVTARWKCDRRFRCPYLYPNCWACARRLVCPLWRRQRPRHSIELPWNYWQRRGIM